MTPAFSHAFIAAEHDTRHNRVVQVSREGEILRQFPVEYPLDLDRRPNGNLLLSSNLAIIELDPEFREVWRYTIDQPALFSCSIFRMGTSYAGILPVPASSK